MIRCAAVGDCVIGGERLVGRLVHIIRGWGRKGGGIYLAGRRKGARVRERVRLAGWLAPPASPGGCRHACMHACASVPLASMGLLGSVNVGTIAVGML